MPYNKVKYWNERNEPNSAQCKEVTHLHLNKTKPFILPNCNILEYGPGIGRMLDLYLEQKHINFYDISENYKSRLKIKCEEKKIPIKKFIIDVSGKIKTPFKDNEFDVVCVFEVLLHCPEEEINELINELARIGKKVIAITWYKKGKTEKDSTHCWTRDYKDLLNKNNLKLIYWDENSLNSQVFFVYE